MVDDIEELEQIGLQKVAGIFRQLSSVTLSLHYIAGVSGTTVQEHALAAIEALESVMVDVRAAHFDGWRQSRTPLLLIDESAVQAVSSPARPA